MAHTKPASKRKRGRRALNIWGAAGGSFARGGAASAIMPVATVPSLDRMPLPEIALDEEEISDVTLGTFYVFDKENEPRLGQGIRLAAHGCGRCGRCGGGCAAARCAGAARCAVARCAARCGSAAWVCGRRWCGGGGAVVVCA